MPSSSASSTTIREEAAKVAREHGAQPQINNGDEQNYRTLTGLCPKTAVIGQALTRFDGTRVVI